MRTAEEFQQQVKKLDVSRWPFRKCSLCDCSICYVFNSIGQVGFYPGCGCSDRGEVELRSWQDVADFYNMQEHPTTIAEMDAFWKWGAP